MDTIVKYLLKYCKEE